MAGSSSECAHLWKEDKSDILHRCCQLCGKEELPPDGLRSQEDWVKIQMELGLRNRDGSVIDAGE
jgi:hypothetical protein